MHSAFTVQDGNNIHCRLHSFKVSLNDGQQTSPSIEKNDRRDAHLIPKYAFHWLGFSCCFATNSPVSRTDSKVVVCPTHARLS
jgi:hypothetical protein